jgi:hypothetical protein
MTKIQFSIPDDLTRKAQQRAAESGFATLDEYLQSLVRSDVEGVDYGPAKDAAFSSEKDLEIILNDRLSGGASIEATPEFWRELSHQFANRTVNRSTE